MPEISRGTNARMRSFADVPDADLRALRAPTLIVIGDRDIVKPEHALELTHSIPSSRLMILVGGHGDYLGEAIMSAPPPPSSFSTKRRVNGLRCAFSLRRLPMAEPSFKLRMAQWSPSAINSAAS